MRNIISKGYFRYEITPGSNIELGQNALKFDNISSAQCFLSGCLHDYFNMKAFRSILSAQLAPSHLNRISDQDVIKILAQNLALGRNKIVLITELKPPMVKAGGEPVQDVQGPRAPSAVREAPQLSDRSTGPDPAMINQAETLKTASANGTPLCEE